MSRVNRRSFIKSTAGAAALAMMGRTAAGANERIRVGVIGMRNRGHQVAESMFKTGRFELAAFCDCDSAMYARALEQMKEKPDQDPVFVQDFRQLLDDKDIDAVVVATPDHWHAVNTVLALDAGKHVFVEKPMTFNINEGKAMIAAANQHPELVVQVGTQQRSGGHFQEARAFVREGGLGKVGFARAWITQIRPRLPIVPDSDPPETMDYDLWCGPGPLLPYNEHLRHYNWHFTKAYGTGEMGNWGAHWIDIVRWFLDLDLPTRVSGDGGIYVVHDAKETPDTQTAIYSFPETTVLWEQRIWSSFPIQGQGGGVELVGEKGGLLISRGGWSFTPHGGEAQRHGRSEMELAHANNFADCIQGRGTPAAPIEEGHKTSVMCHLANIVVELGREVIFDPVAQTFPHDAGARELLGRENRAPWPAFQV